MDHFFSPRNAYRMQDPAVVGRAGHPGRGNFMPPARAGAAARPRAASFQTYGCCPAIAAGSLLVGELEGLPLSEAPAWTDSRINEALGGLPSHKRHCSRLAADALSDALRRLSSGGAA
jgi:nitrogen fixation NifU-like protein